MSREARSAAQSQFPRPEMQEIGKPPSSTCPACREPSRPDRCPDDCWCHCHRETAAQGRYYQAIIKVNPTDKPERQASDIADGIGYACALLLDEHGWSAERVADLLERVTDEVADSEAQRG